MLRVGVPEHVVFGPTVAVSFCSEGNTNMNNQIETETLHLEFEPGDMVVALEDLDPEGANVPAGTFGVVFGFAADFLGESDPMVRWFSGTACSVALGEARLVSPLEVKEKAASKFLSLNARCHTCQSNVSTTFSVNAELLRNNSPERMLSAQEISAMTVAQIVEFFEVQPKFPHLFPNATRAERGREETTKRMGR